MRNWHKEPDEFVEIPDEHLEEKIPEEVIIEKLETLDAEWAEDIKRIEDPEVMEEEIKAAEEIMEHEREMKEGLESGEITEDHYAGEYEIGLMQEKRKAITRCFFKSKGYYDSCPRGLFEGWDTRDPESPEMAKNREDLRMAIDAIGPESVRYLSDRMLNEGRISRETHETISQQVRLSEE